MLVKTTMHLVDIILSNGGITLNPSRFTTVETGFAVEVKGLQASTVSYFKRRNVNVYQQVTRNVEHAEDKGVMYGAWINNGIVYQGLTKVYSDIEDALSIAKAFNQRYIFDIKNQKLIKVLYDSNS